MTRSGGKKEPRWPAKVAEAAPAYAAGMAAAEPARRKNLRLHQSKIDAAMAALGTATETETIEAALDLVAFRKELVEGIRSMRGAGIEDLFGGG